MRATTTDRRATRLVWLAFAPLALAGCTGPSVPPAATTTAVATKGTSSTTSAPSVTATTVKSLPATTAPDTPAPTTSRPPEFDSAAALERVAALAAIGPRDAVSPTYRRAADQVTEWLRATGHEVTQQPFDVPAGTSWGVPVPAGRSVNVVADPPGFRADRPHVVVGAHLDTVPQAPGAEDNASGVSVLVELARMTAAQSAGLPVRFVVFGAEEARGSGWRWYAFGSRYFVDRLSPVERQAVRGMMALDRVGVATPSVPVCHGGRGSTELARAVRDTASLAVHDCINRGSDHVSFERVGVPAARIGSVPYRGYHTDADVPAVVDAGQLQRSGSIAWSWLRSLRP